MWEEIKTCNQWCHYKAKFQALLRSLWNRGRWHQCRVNSHPRDSPPLGIITACGGGGVECISSGSLGKWWAKEENLYQALLLDSNTMVNWMGSEETSSAGERYVCDVWDSCHGNSTFIFEKYVNVYSQIPMHYISSHEIFR